jgi:DNA-binding response OmpR family regulator
VSLQIPRPPGSRRVSRDEQEIRLTATEYRLLEFMMRRSGQVLPRGAIVEAVWGFNEDIEENTLEAFVSSLRNKIDRDFSRKLIHTIRGVGYCVREQAPR